MEYQSADEVSVEGEEDPAAAGPVQMTPEEILMSNEMEDYSDELKREQDLQMRESMGKTQVAFFDISSMGPISKTIYFVLIMAGFGAVLYKFKQELVPDTVDEQTARRQKILERRNKKQN